MAGAGFVHASCVVIGEAGVLVRGASGRGKSRLCHLLCEAVTLRGGFARLVGDDRIALEVRSGRLLARPHPALAGAVELRGIGIVPVANEASARIRLVVDLVDAAPARMPEAAEMMIRLDGVSLHHMKVGPGETAEMAAFLVLQRLALLADTES